MKLKSEGVTGAALRGGVFAALLALGAAGCGKKAGDESQPVEQGQAVTKPQAADDHHDDDHHHDEGKGHEDAKGGHEHGDVKHDLGRQSAGAWGVSVTQMDAVAAGGETVFYLVLDGPDDPPHIRIWVGDKEASNSVKEAGEPAGDPRRYHAHVQIPEGYGETDKFWVELEAADGAIQAASFDIAK